jgi:hypothetical protein
MTEAEWQTGTDLAAHVRYACERLSPRRQRLLAAGFCRAVSHLFDHPDLTDALAVIERYADGLAPAAEAEKARQRCRQIAVEAWEAYNAAVDRGSNDGLKLCVRNELAWAVAFAASTPLPVAEVGNRATNAAVQARTGGSLLAPVPSAEFAAAAAEQARVMRAVVWDVAGNPFRPVEFSPSWRTDTAVVLARQMYESRDFSAMPILADALQDAGCENEDVLNHCRGDGPHVRGCWVVDLVLGKQ